MIIKSLLLAAISMLMLPLGMMAQTGERADSVAKEHNLSGVEVKAASSMRSKTRTENVDLIGQGQLIRAACCNLGESFTTNPSVDVSYSDAATGAKQIKLLGLSGTYVQMLTENIPNLRGASLPYSLGYVPGPWMQSIQVSKGASSVKNGYESITGQINIEFLKPQGTDGIRANAYLDNELKQEVNLDGSIHLNDRLSTSTLLHFENRQMDHDGNGDGFMDMPKLRQYNVMHRWAYVSPLWISQLSMRVLRDERNSGQSSKHIKGATSKPYTTSVAANRYEAQWKNGFTLNAEHNTSIALMLHGSIHDADNTFGHAIYDVKQKNSYSQLMFETDVTENHNISVGASWNFEDYKENYDNGLYGFPGISGWRTYCKESVAGLYAQYTYKLGDKLTIMPGIRWDHSNQHGGFFTPRLHVKYTPWDVLTLRASAGKGYRTPHALAENVSLLTCGRTVLIDQKMKQEEAWNYGVSAGLNIPIADKNLELNTEYYYTHFVNQMVINFDGTKGAHTLSFENLDGKSYSHTLQVDATYPFFEGFTATGAFRLNDVKCTYDGVLRQKPLTSRYKGLLTLSFKTPMELWQFDVTGQMNGGGELYNREKYPSYFQLQAQVTREFRHFSIYLGGENLTNYKISNPIIEAHNPWSPAFDATQVWGPVTGAMAYVGIRIKFEKL
ncbi:MAG: TonB-dependent receptor [Prevotellaceae bacterium]|nr:TonB-dependent receptor [Candidatus Minthosoma equi]